MLRSATDLLCGGCCETPTEPRRHLWLGLLLAACCLHGCGYRESRAFDAARATNTKVAYQQFLSQFPRGVRVAEARKALERIEEAEKEQRLIAEGKRLCSQADRLLARGDRTQAWRLYQYVLAYLPLSPRARTGVLRCQAGLRPKRVTLPTACQRGWVKAVATGSGLRSVRVELTRATPSPLWVVIPAGTYFSCQGGSQDMVCARTHTADLTDRTSETASLDACCANFHRATPGSFDSFGVLPAPDDDELRRLMVIIDRECPSVAARQVAVWAITDDPSPSELQRVYRLRSSFDSFGSGSPAASEEDLREARRLLKKAHIDPSAKRLFAGDAW